MAAKLKTGDKVIVLAGNERGRRGTITRIDRKSGRAVVEGINLRVRHRKPTEGNPAGRDVVAMPIAISNLAMLDPKDDVPTRVGFRFEDGQKVRYAKKSGETING